MNTSGGKTDPLQAYQIERWVQEHDPNGAIAEISVICYPGRIGSFQITYSEQGEVRLNKPNITSIDELAKALTRIRLKVDPDAFNKGKARFVRRSRKQ